MVPRWPLVAAARDLKCIKYESIQYGEEKLIPFTYMKGINFATPYCIRFVLLYIIFSQYAFKTKLQNILVFDNFLYFSNFSKKRRGYIFSTPSHKFCFGKERVAMANICSYFALQTKIHSFNKTESGKAVLLSD